MTKLKEFFTEEQRKKVNVANRNYAIGRQFDKLIRACYKMPANITKVDGKLVSVFLYKTGEKYMPSIEKGVVVMINCDSATYVEYDVESFIERYQQVK